MGWLDVPDDRAGSDDGTGEGVDRLEAAARERWGDAWTIRTLRRADGSTESYAFRSRGTVPATEHEFDESAVVLRERLWVDGDATRVERVRVRKRDVRVLDRTFDGECDCG